MDNPLKGIDGQLMVMAAHRYCLGRQSYIVGSALDWLWKHREHFENNTKFVIVRDTVEALMDGHAGADFDTKGWHDFALNLYNEMSPEHQASVRRAVAHNVATKGIHMSEMLDTAVAIIAVSLIFGRWIYLEIYSADKILDQSTELLNYSSRCIKLENKLGTIKRQLSSVTEENKHLQEELDKIREITDQWRLKT